MAEAPAPARITTLWRRHRWVGVAGIAVAAYVLALWGLSALPPQRRPSWPDRFYDSLVLFHFGTPVAAPYTAQFEVARWLAPLAIGFAGLWAVGTIFREQALRLRVRFGYRDHLVVCGLGAFGHRSAIAFRRAGYRVVVVDHAPVDHRVTECNEHNIPVLRGNAADLSILRDAGVLHARFLLAVCGEDSLNADVAVRTHELQRRYRRSRRPVRCFVHVDDEELCRLLEESSLERSVSGPAGSTTFVNLHRSGPVALLAAFPKALEDWEGLRPHVVVIGPDRFADDLVALVGRTWWSTHLGERRMRVTFVSPEADRRSKDLQARYPHLIDRCDLVAVNADPSDDHVVELDTAGWAPPTVFVCVPDEAASLRATLGMRRQVPAGSVVVACTSGESGAATLLDVVPTLDHVSVDAFPLLDRVCQPEEILNNRSELISRAFHEHFLANRRADGTYSPELHASHRPWDELDETYRDANRDQAASYVERLSSVGYEVRSTDDWDPPLPSFTDEEVEAMAAREHERWCEERRRDGWRYSVERDDRRKLHPDLAKWEQLTELKKEEDRQPVRELPGVLARYGFAVVPRPPSPQGTSPA